MGSEHRKRGDWVDKQADAAKTVLCQQLGTVDTSLGFLLLIIAATLLSFWSVSIQRDGLCLTLRGETEAAGALPPVYPIKHKASAIIVGALGFFLCLALDTLRRAETGDDCVAQRSARTNVWASLLVLAAGILRYQDLDFVERCQRGLTADDTLPD